MRSLLFGIAILSLANSLAHRASAKPIVSDNPPRGEQSAAEEPQKAGVPVRVPGYLSSLADARNVESRCLALLKWVRAVPDTEHEDAEASGPRDPLWVFRDEPMLVVFGRTYTGAGKEWRNEQHKKLIAPCLEIRGSGLQKTLAQELARFQPILAQAFLGHEGPADPPSLARYLGHGPVASDPSPPSLRQDKPQASKPSVATLGQRKPQTDDLHVFLRQDVPFFEAGAFRLYLQQCNELAFIDLPSPGVNRLSRPITRTIVAMVHRVTPSFEFKETDEYRTTMERVVFPAIERVCPDDSQRDLEIEVGHHVDGYVIYLLPPRPVVVEQLPWVWPRATVSVPVAVSVLEKGQSWRLHFGGKKIAEASRQMLAVREPGFSIEGMKGWLTERVATALRNKEWELREQNERATKALREKERYEGWSYSPETGFVVSEAQIQLEKDAPLRGTFDGRAVDGWTMLADVLRGGRSGGRGRLSFLEINEIVEGKKARDEVAALLVARGKWKPAFTDDTRIPTDVRLIANGDFAAWLGGSQPTTPGVLGEDVLGGDKSEKVFVAPFLAFQIAFGKECRTSQGVWSRYTWRIDTTASSLWGGTATKPGEETSYDIRSPFIEPFAELFGLVIETRQLSLKLKLRRALFGMNFITEFRSALRISGCDSPLTQTLAYNTYLLARQFPPLHVILEGGPGVSDR